LYWNIEGIKSKTKLFYNSIIKRQPGIFFLSETWHQNSYNNKLLERDYVIQDVPGERKSNRGRFSKGFIIGIHKDHLNSFELLEINSIYCIYKLRAQEDSSDLFLLFCYLPPSQDNVMMRTIFEKLHPIAGEG